MNASREPTGPPPDTPGIDVRYGGVLDDSTRRTSIFDA